MGLRYRTQVCVYLTNQQCIIQIMKAKLKRLHSPDIDIENYAPSDDDYRFTLQVIVGPDDSDGEESFDITVCSPKWLARKTEESGILSGRHHLIVTDYAKLVPYLEKFIDDCEGESWTVITDELGRLGHWEFEDYKEHS